MINEQDKQRIEKEAQDFMQVIQVESASANKFYKSIYIAGATAELERSEKLLQEYREVIRELLPMAETHLKNKIRRDQPYWKEEHGQIKNLIERAKSLIEPKTDKT